MTLTTGAAYQIIPTLSAYGISKLAVLKLMTYVAPENLNVMGVALHPGVVDTEMTINALQRFAHDTPELVGGTAVWIARWDDPERNFLSGISVNVNWDV